MKLLNSKSIIECDEVDWEVHANESMDLLDKILELKNFDCFVIKTHQDIAHKGQEEVLTDMSLWNIYDLAEYTDCKNGADLSLDDEGFLTLSVYGQMYEFKGEHHMNHCDFKVMPFTDDMKFIDVSGYMLKGEPLKQSKFQYKEEKKSTLQLLDELKEKVKENSSKAKDDKKRDRDSER